MSHAAPVVPVRRARRLPAVAAALALVGSTLALTAGPAMADAVIQVTTTLDQNGEDPALCSLREAVESADTDLPVGGCSFLGSPGDDVIAVPASADPYVVATTIVIDSNVNIFGGGFAGAVAADTVLDGQESAESLFFVAAGTIVAIHNVTIQNGDSDGGGGGIHNEGRLTVAFSTVTANEATGPPASQHGGGIYNAIDGELFVSESTIAGNEALGNGGGIYNLGVLHVFVSTIEGNTAGNNGGGIWNSGQAEVFAGTIAGNAAAADGVGDAVFTTVPVPDDGAFTVAAVGDLSLQATIVASGDGAENCSGTIIDLGRNLDSANSCAFTTAAPQLSLINTDPGLDALGDNGGGTPTMALLPVSPAIDYVPADECFESDGDQRGLPRPQEGDGVAPTGCDIGAFEVALPVVTTAVHDDSHAAVVSVLPGTRVHDEATVTGIPDGPVPLGVVRFTFFTTTSDCTGPSVPAGSQEMSLGVAESDFVENLAAGSYSFLAHYDGYLFYAPADGPCEPLTVGSPVVGGDLTVAVVGGDPDFALSPAAVAPFTLDVDESVTFEDIPADEYVLTMTDLEAGLVLDAITCGAATVSVDLADRSVTFALADGAAVTCTFTVSEADDPDDPYDTYDDDPGDPDFDFDTPFDAGDDADEPPTQVAADNGSGAQPGSDPAPSILGESFPGIPEGVVPAALDQLPRTGSGVADAAVAGSLLVGLGALVSVLSRRRRARA